MPVFVTGQNLIADGGMTKIIICEEYWFRSNKRFDP